MPEIMSQREVDRLLDGVDQHPAAEEMSEAAIDALLSKARAFTDRFDDLPEDVIVYDFKRPERLSVDQIRSIERLFEAMEGNLGNILSNTLETDTAVKVVSVEQLTFQEFVMSLPNPTYHSLLESDKHGGIVLEVNPSISLPIAHKLLGRGLLADAAVPSGREMSETEVNAISEFVLNPFLHEINVCLGPVFGDIAFRLKKVEANPLRFYIVPPNEVTVLICIEIKCGGCSGMLNIAIPWPVLEPVVHKLSTIGHWFPDGVQSDHAAASLDESLGDVEVDVVAHRDFKGAVTLKDVLGLKGKTELGEGSVLRLCRKWQAPGHETISVNGVAKFKAVVDRRETKDGVWIPKPKARIL